MPVKDVKYTTEEWDAEPIKHLTEEWDDIDNAEPIDGEVQDDDYDDPSTCWGTYISDIDAQALAEQISLLSYEDGKLVKRFIACLNNDCLSCSYFGHCDDGSKLMLDLIKRLR